MMSETEPNVISEEDHGGLLEWYNYYFLKDEKIDTVRTARRLQIDADAAMCCLPYLATRVYSQKDIYPECFTNHIDPEEYCPSIALVCGCPVWCPSTLLWSIFCYIPVYYCCLRSPTLVDEMKRKNQKQLVLNATEFQLSEVETSVKDKQPVAIPVNVVEDGRGPRQHVYMAEGEDLEGVEEVDGSLDV